MKSEVTKDLQRFEQQLEVASIEARQDNAEILASIGGAEDREALAFACRLMGQAEMARAVSDFANVSAISKLAEIKKNKLYRRFTGFSSTGSDGETPNASTWAGFCRALGMSHQKVDEDIRNLHAFGEETLERLNQLGLGYRNMRRLRQIPDSERIAIIEGKQIEVGDKEEVVELIEEMAAKHAREKQELTDKVKHLESERQVDQRLLEDKEKKLNELERELRRDLTPDQAAQKRAERDELLKSELMDKALSSISMLNELARAVEKIMDLEDRTDHLEESLYAELRGVFRHALLLGRQYDILPEQLLGIPVADLEAFDQVIEGETA